MFGLQFLRNRSMIGAGKQMREIGVQLAPASRRLVSTI